MIELNHHAYLVIGKREAFLDELKSLYPNSRHQKFDRLGIEDSRSIRDEQNQTNITGGKKIFILEIRTITLEGQNALLKVLEEPTPETHFFILVSSAETLLPTVRSRLQTIKTEKENLDCTLAQEFLNQNPGSRLDWLKKTDLPNNFLDQIEQILEKNKNLGGYRELLLARRYWSEPGASHKLLLEHLATTL